MEQSCDLIDSIVRGYYLVISKILLRVMDGQNMPTGSAGVSLCEISLTDPLR